MRSITTIFTDEGPELSADEQSAAVGEARRLALASLGTFRTVHIQYRSYRRSAGHRFMAFPEWRTHYRQAQRGFMANAPKDPTHGIPPGGFGY